MLKYLRAELLLCVLLFFYVSAQAADFVYTDALNEAQKHLACMRIEKARSILNEEQARNKENIAVVYLQNLADYYAFVTSQSAEDLHVLEKNKNQRLNQIRLIPAASPYKLYAEAELNLHWAFSHVFNQEYFTAAIEIRDAYKLLIENEKKFPAFTHNQKSLGMLMALLGSVPENYRWMLSIAGMKGDLDKGMTMLKKYIQNFKTNERMELQSAQFYYTFLLLNFGDKQDCWRFCEQVTSDYETSLMSNYLRGFVCIKTGRTDEAINTLSRKPRGSEYSSFVYLDYLMGQAKLNKLEPDADVYLKRFVSLFKGKNLLKDAYKKLSWSYIVQGDTAKYLVYRGLSKKYGVAQSDEDKNAQKEAESGLLPNIYLLKARLLFDGGYYTKAEHEIRTLTMASLQSEYRLAEYYYRYGRILHESNKYSKAIEMYSKCIATPGSSGLYFAPSSCLQLGYIYEKLGFKELAKIHFEKALSYRGYEYRSSVSQKAKAALSRIN